VFGAVASNGARERAHRHCGTGFAEQSEKTANSWLKPGHERLRIQDFIVAICHVWSGRRGRGDFAAFQTYLCYFSVW
jgi:hypothetical protein